MGDYYAAACTQAGRRTGQHCIGGKGVGFTCSGNMGVFNADTGIHTARKKHKLYNRSVSTHIEKQNKTNE